MKNPNYYTRFGNREKNGVGVVRSKRSVSFYLLNAVTENMLTELILFLDRISAI